MLLQQLAEYVAEEVGPGADEVLTRQLTAMRNACENGISLIRDFVDHEFLQSAQVALNLERHDLVKMLGVVVENYQQDQLLIAKHFSYSATLPAIHAVLGYNKFQQIINSLLSNFIKFTPDQGRISVEVSERPNHVRITVADDGIGIPARHLPHLFERFTPARRPGLRGEKTTGLGLSIVQTIMQLHRGRVWAESEEGRGTTFFLELPLSPGWAASSESAWCQRSLSARENWQTKTDRPRRSGQLVCGRRTKANGRTMPRRWPARCGCRAANQPGFRAAAAGRKK